MPEYHVRCDKCGCEDDIITERYLQTGDYVIECEICGGRMIRDGVELCARTKRAWAGYLLSDM